MWKVKATNFVKHGARLGAAYIMESGQGGSDDDALDLIAVLVRALIERTKMSDQEVEPLLLQRTR